MSDPTTDQQRPAPCIVADDVRKVFRDGKNAGRPALNGVSLTVSPGEFVVLLGPSGCGKTTLLRSIAGLETPDSGQISIGGRTVFSGDQRTVVPPDQRNLNMVFQSYALWPHMTLLDNVAFPLRSRKVPRQRARARAAEMLELVGLADRHAARPSQLSGGQQQRVALARALASESVAVLFDEPLSNLDAKVRERLRVELVQIQRRLGFAALYVTHDQTEAMAMADTVVVMRDGEIEQVGSASAIYDHPLSRSVATFVGGTNELSGTVMSLDADGIGVETKIGRLHAVRDDRQQLSIGQSVSVMFRPEHCIAVDGAAAGAVSGHLGARVHLGGVMEYLVVVAGETLTMRSTVDVLPEHGDEVHLWIPPERILVFPREPAVAASGGNP